jgi:probable F420-dependent oxidoreductase
MMHFGVMFANTGRFATGEGAVALARTAEDAGFESVWTVEHVVVPKGYQSEYPYDPSGRMPGGEDAPIPDPLTWLSFVGSATSTLKLGTGIVILPQRNPVVFAKECATLDSMTNGRLLLGVGAGWLEEEFEALDVPFAERGRRLDDHIGALRALWAEGASSYQGPYTEFAPVYSYPKPAQGSVPIIIGGHSEAAARRAGRLGDGFFPARGSAHKLRELFDVMRYAAVEAGRDPDAIELTTGGAAAFAPDPVAALREYEEIGVSRVVLPPLARDVAGLAEAYGQFSENVIQKVNR